MECTTFRGKKNRFCADRRRWAPCPVWIERKSILALDAGASANMLAGIMLRFLARCLALLGAIGFVPLAVCMIFLYAVAATLPDPATHKRTLDRVGLYQKAPAAMAECLAAGLNVNLAGLAERKDAPEGLPQFIRGLPVEDWKPLLRAAFPPELLRKQAEGCIDQVCGYFNGDEERPHMKLTLAEFKQSLKGPVLREAYVRVLSDKPAGTASTQTLPYSIRPAGLNDEQLGELMSAALSDVAGGLPDSVDVLGAVIDADRSGNTLAALGFLRDKLRTYTLMAYLSPAVAAALLILVLLLAARSVRAALFWAGIPCLVAGALCALLALPSASLTHWTISTFVLPQLPPQVPAITTDIMLSLATTTFDEVLGAAFDAGLILGLCGLIATLVACLLKAKTEPKAS